MEEVIRNSNVGENVADDNSEGVETRVDDSVDGMQWRRVDSIDEFLNIDFQNLTFEETMKYSFRDFDLGYHFYNAYGGAKGFSIRRHLTARNTKGEIVSKSFVSSKQGLRHKKWDNIKDRKKVEKGRSRCCCKAELRIYLEKTTGRWNVGYFNEAHTHQLLTDFGVIHRSQCQLSEAELAKVSSLRKVGIKNPQIYAAIAERVGGYPMVGFKRKSLYNKISGRSVRKEGDANQALKYMRRFSRIDPGFFWKHLTNSEGRLLHLFWCDSTSRSDYEAFGDVVAFDSTYGKNKCKCPVVVFSGVNHHLQTIVFGTAIVSNEEEVTYTWLLEQLVEAMNGKVPKCVITDGALAMRNAIGVVFPCAHHRLCAWHLLKNAGKKVHNPKFLKGFKECMFNDFDIPVFEARWKLICDGCGVGDNEWVKAAYAKKEMWATAYTRGKFFAGLRTTSRCEALHSQMRKYVASRQNLCEFIEQVERCWELMRYNELTADFKTLDEHPTLITPFKILEKSAAGIYSKEVFRLVQRLLFISAEYKVVDWRETLSNVVFEVVKYPNEIGTWLVFMQRSDSKFYCDCKRMESFGLCCVHILAVIYKMNYTEFPDSIVSLRWTMKAKHFVGTQVRDGIDCCSSGVVSHYTSLVMLCRRMCAVACLSLEKFNAVRDKVFVELAELEKEDNGGTATNEAPVYMGGVTDPPMSGPHSAGKHCSRCRAAGHNVRRCPVIIEGMDRKEVSDNGDDYNVYDYDELVDSDSEIESSVGDDEPDYSNIGGYSCDENGDDRFDVMEESE